MLVKSAGIVHTVRMRSYQLWSTVSLGLVIVGAGAIAACGSSGTEPVPPVLPTGTATGTSTTTGDGGTGPTLGDMDAAPTVLPLFIEPATASIEVTSRSMPKIVDFVVKEGTGANSQVVTQGISWVLDKYDAGDISQGGKFQTNGKAAGTIKVSAVRNGRSVVAELKVTMKLAEDLPVPVSTPANKTALAGAPIADPGGANATQILYPLTGTVLPRGLSSPTLQFSPGSLPPEDAKIVLECVGFRWEGTGKLGDSGKPQVTVPQDAWDAFTQSCGGQKAKVSVIKASGGVAYGPATIDLTIAPASLKGAVYYQSYEGESLGLWSVRPGVREPAKHLIKGCVVCHSVSANGETLAAGADEGSQLVNAGTYKTDTQGNISQISQAPSGFGGDNRSMSFATLTPDGKYVMRSKNDFWGGPEQRAFRVNQAGNATTQMGESTVVGLDGVSAFVPMFSPDGKRYIFVNGDSTPNGLGTARRSMSIMDVTINDMQGANGTLSFSNRKLLRDNGVDGQVIREPAFLPDSKQVVFQEGPAVSQSHGGMLSLFSGNKGRIFIQRDTEHLELTASNKGIVPGDEDLQGMPTVLPVQAGGYFWIVFTSRRAYGNQKPDSTGKQLWVAAISPNTPAGTDPSHPAFFLPNQSPSQNERGFWALERCKAEGGACGSGDECCDGFCRPEDPATGKTALVCKKPTTNQCSNASERCKVDMDCCETGNSCVGGFCTPPVPK
jgi:hypothetical protein